VVRILTLCTAALAAVSASVPVTAHAEGPFRTLVLDVAGEGVDPEVAAEVTDIIWAEVERNPAYVVHSKHRETLEDQLFAMACDEPTTECMTLLAEALGAERIVYARLIATDDLHDLTVNVFDLSGARVVRRWSKRFLPNRDFREYFSERMATFLGGGAPTPTVTQLRVSSNVKGAVVYIEGNAVGPVPWMSTEVAPGVMTIEVRAEGFTGFRQSVDLHEGEDRFYNAVLKPLASLAVPPDPTLPPEFSTDNRFVTYGTVVLGVGAATLGAGVAFGVVAQDNADEHASTLLERDARTLRDRSLAQAAAANVLYAVGAAALVTGGTLLIIGLGELEETGQIGSLVILPGQVGVQIGTRW
jgi:hypothetical protein